jgi:hypothetical protein
MAIDQWTGGDGLGRGAQPGLGPFHLSSIRERLWPDTVMQEAEPEKRPLALGVQVVRGMEATDPRDKVYAMLDAINSRLKAAGVEPIIPNYQPLNSIQMVFTDFTIRAIQADNSLEVLAFTNDEMFREIPGLPSWALDLTRSQYPSAILVELHCKASGGVEFEVPTSTDFSYLHTRGYHLDDIANSASPYHTLDSGHVVDWLTLVMQLTIPYHTGEGSTEVLWRTILANTDESGHKYPAPPSCGTHFGHYLFSQLIMPRNPTEMQIPNEGRRKWLLQGLKLLAMLREVDPNGTILDIDDLKKTLFHALRGGE